MIFTERILKVNNIFVGIFRCTKYFVGFALTRTVGKESDTSCHVSMFSQYN